MMILLLTTKYDNTNKNENSNNNNDNANIQNNNHDDHEYSYWLKHLMVINIFSVMFMGRRIANPARRVLKNRTLNPGATF